MKHSSIAVFIPHSGCPNRCSFCNQHVISATAVPPHPDEVDRIFQKALEAHRGDAPATELAFFGGSFTAVKPDYMKALLEIASAHVHKNGLGGIRFSTRPDCFGEDMAETLSHYPIKTVEFGAQSMSDRVLEMNRRGHTSDDVRQAVRTARRLGFQVVLQMMTGLYGAGEADDLHTCEELIRLEPDAVRVYPTVVLRGTKLERHYNEGQYLPPDTETSAVLCARLMERFCQCGVPVLKVGLHASREVLSQMVAGAYHPAFRELCESRIYYQKASSVLSRLNSSSVTLLVAPREISKMAGQHRANIEKLQHKFQISIKIKGDAGLVPYQVAAAES